MCQNGEFKIVKIRERIKSLSHNLSSIIIPLLQYVPTASIWRGIMSIPLIIYLIFFFQNPTIFKSDFWVFNGYIGTFIALLGLTLYFYCLIYQITHRKRLIQTGPYHIIRHPQYLSLIILISGLTLVSFQTSPITIFNPYDRSSYLVVFIIWILEVLAYITLAKIEEVSLKVKYGEFFIDYANKVPFMYPFLRLDRSRSHNEKDSQKLN